MTKFIGEFMERYNKEVDFFTNLSSQAEDLLRAQLNEAGVRCIVSSRSKDPKRLIDKLESRNKKKKYKSVEDIFNDIVDLSGVRVALYFPGDGGIVDDIIKNIFKVNHEKTFPDVRKSSSNKGYQKVFSGYKAKHYRVMLLGNSRYANKHNVEIQVASVLMHAWSEVEHDLVYKPLQGKLSDDELMILDEINGLVLAGNIALERLQQAGVTRTLKDGYEFKNHFDIASFFTTELEDKAAETINYIKIFKVLKSINKLKRSDILQVVEWIKNNKDVFSKKFSSRFINKPENVTEYRKLMYAITETYKDEVLALVIDKEKTINDDNEKKDLIKATLKGSLIISFFVDPALRKATTVAANFEDNYELIGLNEDESLDGALKASGCAFIGDKDLLVEEIIAYYKLINSLYDEFSKDSFEQAIIKNKWLSEKLAPI